MMEMEQSVFSLGHQGAESRQEVLQAKRRYLKLSEFRISLDL